MKLKLIKLNNGEFEIRDTDNNIAVDTSLDGRWLAEMVNEGTLNLYKFDKEDVITILEEVVASLI